MSEDYYKARISELERELAQAYADIKMLEEREQNVARDFQQLIKEGDLQWRAPDCKIEDDEQKLWELYRDSRKQFYLQGNENGVQGGSDTNKDALDNAQEALKVWKERK